MAVQVRIPSLGESVTEGIIVRWAKQDGEPIAVDEVLLELETDKASMEIPSEHAGVLKIVKPAGSTVQVGEVVAEIDETGAPKSAAPTSSPAPSSSVAPAPPAAPAPSPPPAAKAAQAALAAVPTPPPPGPAARVLVEERGVDPATIAGTGKRGQVTKADVLAHVAPPSGVGAEGPGGAAPSDYRGAKAAPPRALRVPTSASAPSAESR